MSSPRIRFLGTVIHEDVEMAVYIHHHGGMFAVDASYIEQEAGPVFDPFEGEEFDADKAEL